MKRRKIRLYPISRTRGKPLKTPSQQYLRAQVQREIESTRRQTREEMRAEVRGSF